MARGPRRSTRIGPLTNVRRDAGAWSVQVTRRGRRFADYFSDAVWGSRERALVAAQRFRDRLLLRIEPDTRVRRRVPKGTRGTTGRVGVSLEIHAVDGRIYRRYVACWQDPQEGPRRRRFLVETYGKKQALALAIEARETGVARGRAQQLVLQRKEALRRLKKTAPMPHQVKDPRSRKGISMARRRPRRVK